MIEFSQLHHLFCCVTDWVWSLFSSRQNKRMWTNLNKLTLPSFRIPHCSDSSSMKTWTCVSFLLTTCDHACPSISFLVGNVGPCTLTLLFYRVGHLTFGIWIGYRKKNLFIFIQKFVFIRKIEPFHLRMKHNIIQMTATAGVTVSHSINPIFPYIFDCLGFNPMNGNFDFVLWGLNRLWMVSVTLILNGSPQKRSPTGSNHSSQAANWHQNFSLLSIDCCVGCVENGPVLLKPNVVHVILFNFWKEKFVELSYQNPHKIVTCWECIGFSMMTFGFSEPQMRQFCLLTLLTCCTNNRKCTGKFGWSTKSNSSTHASTKERC